MWEKDEFWMRQALLAARDAMERDEVPVGAVVVRGDEMLCCVGNRRETDGIATAHAEVLAIESACRTLGRWRLSDCTLYVTLEPCPMCAGALINARIGRVVFGAKDAKAGACGSVLQMDAYPLNHRLRAQGGVLERECAALLSEFFEKKRRIRQDQRRDGQ